MTTLLENPSQATLNMRKWRANNLEHSREYQNSYKRAQRKKVYDHYGAMCVCCGETKFEFLSMDHINGGGTQHRIKTGLRGAAMIGWIIRNGYPDDFQVLCHNCNQAKGFYGYCPHSLEA